MTRTNYISLIQNELLKFENILNEIKTDLINFNLQDNLSVEIVGGGSRMPII